MNHLTAALIGGVAGFSIFIGLPVARIRGRPKAVQGFLNALATGVLLFLLWDILSHASAPVEGSLQALHRGSPGAFLSYALIFAGGLGAGLLVLIYFNGLLIGRAKGPAGQGNPRWLSMAIATGLGLHNLSEGLAIGQDGRCVGSSSSKTGRRRAGWSKKNVARNSVRKHEMRLYLPGLRSP